MTNLVLRRGHLRRAPRGPGDLGADQFLDVAGLVIRLQGPKKFAFEISVSIRSLCFGVENGSNFGAIDPEYTFGTGLRHLHLALFN